MLYYFNLSNINYFENFRVIHFWFYFIKFNRLFFFTDNFFLINLDIPKF
jgi:hypothetical protein